MHYVVARLTISFHLLVLGSKSLLLPTTDNQLCNTPAGLVQCKSYKPVRNCDTSPHRMRDIRKIRFFCKIDASNDLIYNSCTHNFGGKVVNYYRTLDDMAVHRRLAYEDC